MPPPAPTLLDTSAEALLPGLFLRYSVTFGLALFSKPAPGLSTANCRNLKQSALSRAQAEVLPARHNLLGTRILITCPIGE